MNFPAIFSVTCTLASLAWGIVLVVGILTHRLPHHAIKKHMVGSYTLLVLAGLPLVRLMPRGLFALMCLAEIVLLVYAFPAFRDHPDESTSYHPDRLPPRY